MVEAAGMCFFSEHMLISVTTIVIVLSFFKQEDKNCRYGASLVLNLPKTVIEVYRNLRNIYAHDLYSSLLMVWFKMVGNRWKVVDEFSLYRLQVEESSHIFLSYL